MNIILHERNLSINEISKEIKITAPSFRNLLYKKVIKPDGDTAAKILSYCKKHSIDTSELDWNEVLYEYFLESGKYSDYIWESDLDSNNYIKVRHKTCGKRSLVPISAFDGKSTLCIHCWFNKFVSEDAYTLKINENNDGYDICHVTCGNQYSVTYEQIKQKKYRCPECYPFSKNANTAVTYNRYNYKYVEQENDTDLDNVDYNKPNILLEDLQMSIQDYNNFKRQGFNDIAKIIEMPIRTLRYQLRDKPLANVLRQLDAKGIRRQDCSYESYPTIDDYISQNLKCSECYSSLYQEGSNTTECLCKNCIERLQRVNADKTIYIELKKTEYMSYTNGQNGVTIFANLTNNLTAPLKVKLQEITLTHRNTQKVSDYNYSGYIFNEDYLFPNTIKSVGKVWIMEHWEHKELEYGDYCVIVLTSPIINKKYYYKFVYRYDYWQLYDFYELD